MKRLKIIIVCQTIIIFFLGILVYNLYFYYDKTSENISNIFLNVNVLYTMILNKIIIWLTALRQAYPNLSSVFNNRELAIIIIGLFFFILLVLNTKTRKSSFLLMKTLFSKKIRNWLMLIAVFLGVVTFVLWKINFWDISLLKTSVVWYFTNGISASFQAVNRAKDIGYFKRVAKSTVTFLIVIEFMMNYFSMTLIKELVFLTVILLITLLKAGVENIKEFHTVEYENLKKVLNFLYGTVFALYVFSSIKQFVTNLDSITIRSIKEMIYPLLLSLCFIIFNFFVVVYSKYEQLFIRINSKKIIKNSLKPYLKFRVLLQCKFNIKRINNFHLDSKILTTYMKTYRDVNKFIKNFKQSYKRS